MNQSTVLSVRSLTVQTEAKTVLHNVSFDLYSNEILCLVGESGSGKSVTLKSILKIIPPQTFSITSGEITVSNINLLTLSSEALRKVRSERIGFVPQSAHTSLNPLRSIGKQLLEIHKHLRSQAIELLHTVGFRDPENILSMRPHQLSGGMKQRALIAMALLNKPSLLLLDEPTTALDVTLQQEVLDLLLDLKKQFSLSMIFVTHDLGVVAKIADRVLVMKQGRIIEEGPVRTVLLSPSHRYTKELVSSCNL